MRGARPELKALEGGLLKAPPPPETLPKVMHKDWREIAADLQGRGLLATSMLGMLESYCVSLWMVRLCRKEIALDGPVVRAKDGQPKPHPCGAMIRSAQENLARLGHDLGLSPASRNRKNVKPTEDESDDDAAALGL